MPRLFKEIRWICLAPVSGPQEWLRNLGFATIASVSALEGRGATTGPARRRDDISALSAMIDAHESERTSLARELHDDIGQRLAVLRMELDGLVQDSALAADLRQRILALSNRTLAIARDIQAISHRLHSPQLDYLGVVPAAAGFCQEVSERLSVAVDFSHAAI